MADEFGLVGVVIIIKKSYGSIIINLFMGYEVIIKQVRLKVDP